MGFDVIPCPCCGAEGTYVVGFNCRVCFFVPGRGHPHPEHALLQAVCPSQTCRITNPLLPGGPPLTPAMETTPGRSGAGGIGASYAGGGAARSDVAPNSTSNSVPITRGTGRRIMGTVGSAQINLRNHRCKGPEDHKHPYCTCDRIDPTQDMDGNPLPENQLSMVTFFYGRELDEILKDLFYQLHAIRTSVSTSVKEALHYADRGEVPDVKRTLRNTLDELGKVP